MIFKINPPFTRMMILFTSLAISSCTNQKKPDYQPGGMLGEWNQELTKTIMQDLFPPPVASRIYAYSHIAAYEAIRHADSKLPGFSGRLNGLEELPQPEKLNDYHFGISGLCAFMETGKKLCYTTRYLDEFKNHFLDSMKRLTGDEPLVDRSEQFGYEISRAILAWASKDNYRETRSAVRYSLLYSPGSWLPTPPDYMQAAESQWNKIRPFVLPDASCFLPDSCPKFSTEKNSMFYKMALDVYQASKNADSNQRSMAIFWDDNPNVSDQFGHLEVFNQKMTPGGHWMAITAHIIKKNNLSLPESSQAFALTSIAIADAFISCWDAKYRFQTIRPVTYINQHIDEHWMPLLQTPPFPEFPSGHSQISAAAATILTEIFGDNFAFTDSSEVPYGLPVRSFKSFYKASDEVALSRFYGGIHFMPANETGKAMGRKTGKFVLQKLLSEHKIEK